MDRSGESASSRASTHYKYVRDSITRVICVCTLEELRVPGLFVCVIPAWILVEVRTVCRS